jgi:putative phosphoribosyl transferase
MTGDTPRKHFSDRHEAGRRLAEALRDRLKPKGVVLGLPRGGVVVASAMAQFLQLPSDVYVVRKLRAPLNQEFAIGAVAEDGPAYVDRAIVESLAIREAYLVKEEAAQRAEILRQVRLYRGGRLLTSITGRQAVVVDDGIATGATVRTAVLGLRRHDPSEVIVAAPVSSPVALRQLSHEADEVLTLLSPNDFWAVGQYYRHFDQVTDEEVAAAVAAGTVHGSSS